jgi:hypothetical protein
MPQSIHLGFWEFTNKAGDKVKVEVTLTENAAYSRSISKMARRALGSKRKKAGALGGALQVTVVPKES